MKYDEKEDRVDMGNVIDEMREDSRKEGIDHNRIRSIKNVMEGLKYTPQQAMDLLKIPAAEQPTYLTRL